MRVTVLTAGSRGDVEPFVGLGTALREAGHDVRLCTHEEFHDRIRAAGLEPALLPGNPREALESAEGRRMLATRNPLLLAGRIGAMVGPMMEEAYPAAEAASRDADVIVYASLAAMGPNVADRLGIPAVAAHLSPATPTSAFAAPVPSARPVPRLLNRASWLLADRLMWRALRPPLQAQRERLGLPPLPTVPHSALPVGTRPETIYGYSPSVVPVPPDWACDLHVTGYWTPGTDPDWTPPPALAAFLDSGPAPVYLGFGSMPDPDPAKLVEVLLGAARQAGRRAVVHSGWSGLRPLDGTDEVAVVGEVPHSWLFARCAAVVHHGGAGTTAAALAAGVPAVVVPYFGDQFFWGGRVAALGAGPPPLARERLTAGALAGALRATAADEMRAAASAMRRRLAAEDGPRAAVAVLERVAGVTRP